MPTDGSLTEKEQELIAVGASIAAGCQPCSRYHLWAARAAGADPEEIHQAVSDALEVRANAAEIMAGLAEKYLEGGPGPAPVRCAEKPLVGQLVSVGAAFAINCADNLEAYLAAARRLGATDGQILSTVGIARAVKSVAEEKIEAAAASATAPSCPDDCACYGEAGKAGSAAAGCCASGGGDAQ